MAMGAQDIVVGNTALISSAGAQAETGEGRSNQDRRKDDRVVDIAICLPVDWLQMHTACTLSSSGCMPSSVRRAERSNTTSAFGPRYGRYSRLCLGAYGAGLAATDEQMALSMLARYRTHQDYPGKIIFDACAYSRQAPRRR